MEIEKCICQSFSVELREAKSDFNSSTVGANVRHYDFEVSIGSKSAERDGEPKLCHEGCYIAAQASSYVQVHEKDLKHRRRRSIELDPLT